MLFKVFKENTVTSIDGLREDVLRVGHEPCGYFDERTVHGLLTGRPMEYYGFVLNSIRDIALGRVSLELPPKQVFADPGSSSDFRVMPCVLRGPSGARKTVKLVGTNTRQKTVADQITVGKAFAIDPEENFVSHIFEACLLSSARTGICSAIAIGLLSKRRSRVVVIGAGRVGYYAAFYAAALGGVDEVLVADIDRARAGRTVELLARDVPGVSFSEESVSSLGPADVVILATTSASPVCSPPGHGADLVVSLGADTDFQSELDPAWASVSDIFVDTMDSARFGDLGAWLKAGLISEDRLVDLFGAIRTISNGAEMTGRQKVFVSTGSALFDNLTIGYLLERKSAPAGHVEIMTESLRRSLRT